MMTKRKPTSDAARDALLMEIAKRHFFLETLETLETLATRNSDRLDFHDVAVWAIRSALAAAYEAGRQSAIAAAKGVKR